MLIGQKCSPLKIFLKYLLVHVVFGSAAFSQIPQTTFPDSIAVDLPLKICRNYPAQNIESDKIASDNEYVFLPLSDGSLKAFDLKSGLVIWNSELGGQIKSAPYISDKGVFLLSETIENQKVEKQEERQKEKKESEKGNSSEKVGENIQSVETVKSSYTVRLLNKKTGIVIWQTKLTVRENTIRENTVGKFYLYSFENNLLIAASEGTLYLLDNARGNLLRQENLPDFFSAVPFFNGENAVFGTADRRIRVFSLKRLEKVSELEIRTIPTAVYADAGTLIWGSLQGEVTAKRGFYKASKIVWRLRAGGEISSLMRFEKTILIASLDNYVYSVSAADGRIIWKKRLSNRPAFEPLKIGQYIVLTTVGDSTAAVVDLKTGRAANKIALADGNFFTGAPQFLASSVVFPTVQGIYSFTSEPEYENLCR